MPIHNENYPQSTCLIVPQFLFLDDNLNRNFSSLFLCLRNMDVHNTRKAINSDTIAYEIDMNISVNKHLHLSIIPFQNSQFVRIPSLQ
mmetsp:Transcript_67819/g.100496  ORF Transcript_67819/g.100496 Transcript_67819/m.100496 type:complete len:88 (+) Transcript_67819:115-378(+)